MFIDISFDYNLIIRIELIILYIRTVNEMPLPLKRFKANVNLTVIISLLTLNLNKSSIFTHFYAMELVEEKR